MRFSGMAAEDGERESFSDHKTGIKPIPKPKEVEFIRVVFSRTEKNEIKGIVKQDSSKRFIGEDRTKIVFIFGYRPEKNQTWIGHLPLHEEEWLCHVVQDTLPENPRKGVLKVRLIDNLTAKQKAAEEKERLYFAPILEHIDNLETAREIEKICQDLMAKHGLRVAKGIISQQVKEYQKFPADTMLAYNQATLAWLNQLIETGIKPGEFEHLGKRDFRCKKCGGTNKISKETYQDLKQQTKHTYVCDFCGTKGDLKI